jgi:hypothetical protein
MSSHDFKGLHDKEFEALCADLLGVSMSVRFECFKPGPDRGVDARCFEAGGEIILQCKHRPASPIAQLARHLRDEEAPKAEKLGATRYLLAVSHALSRADKTKLAESLHPHIKSDSDVFGPEDLMATSSNVQELAQSISIDRPTLKTFRWSTWRLS